MANKKDIETYALTFRLPVSVLKQLDELCLISDQKRGEFLIDCITSQYDHLQGDPKLQELLLQFKVLKGSMERYVNGSED